MSVVIHVDFLFARLCRDISKWYDEHYFGKDLEHRKNTHLMVMQEKYENSIFSDIPELLEEEVKDFLTKVQLIM